MYIYNYRIFDKYGHPVASFAVLTDDSPTWRPQQFRYETLGCEVSLRFPITKLLDYGRDWASLEANNNPFAIVALAHLQTQATRHNPQARLDAKLTLCRLLYKRGYRKKDILELFRFIDWLMDLPVELKQQFQHRLEAIETEVNMRYVTSIEQMAIEKGMQQGMQQGVQQGMRQMAQETLLAILEDRFGPVAEEIVVMVGQTTDVPTLQNWTIRAATIETLLAFKQYISKRPGSSKPVH